MTAWEYRTERVQDDSSIEAALNKLGAFEWEVFQVLVVGRNGAGVFYRILARRPKP